MSEYLDKEGLAYYTAGIKKLIDEAEPEAITEEQIEEMVNAEVEGEGGGGFDEMIAMAVAAYMAEHPVTGGTSTTISTVELPAANWVGEGILYSQVVTIEGVTKRSKVSLSPSVEQLVIFRAKDLTFVTENDDGVVTVYAIGQRPANDYNIQVTIEEVIV